MTLRIFSAAAALVLMTGAAFAQSAPQPEQPDPRIAREAVAFLQAAVNLNEAKLKAVLEDARKREAEWAAYSRPLWAPEAAKADPAPAAPAP